MRSTPNQNQQEKKKEGRDNHAEKKSGKKERTEEPKRPRTKARWIGEGGASQLDGRNESGTKNGEGQERGHQRNKTTKLTQKLGS